MKKMRKGGQQWDNTTIGKNNNEGSNSEVEIVTKPGFIIKLLYTLFYFFIMANIRSNIKIEVE